jgi:putative ABC transport system substrate-binding protein
MKIQDQKPEISKSAGLRALLLAFSFVLALLVMVSYRVEAQQTKDVHRVGYLATRSGPGPGEKAFLDGLASLGYIEGRNIAIEWRYAHEQMDRLPELASELVRLNVAAIVATGGYPSVRAAKNATSTIPIVMTGVSDAVGLGFVTSLARPGGNITGLSNLAPELSGKLLELAKEAIPSASRIAAFAYSASPNWKLYSKYIEATAQSLGVRLLVFHIHEPDEISKSFDDAMSQRADALVIPSSAFLALYRKTIIRLATENRLPAIAYSTAWADEGCLLTYGASVADFNRRAAIYVNKILKGAKPNEIPIERPTKFELAINLKTAKQIGLTIPPNVLTRADKIIR